MYIRGFTEFGIKVLWRLQFLEYLIEDLTFRTSKGSDQNWSCPESALLAVSAKLRQLAGQTQDNFFVRAFWNFQFKVLWPIKKCSLHNTLIPILVKPLMYICTINFICTSHSAYVAAETELHGVKIDGLLLPNFL